MQTINTDVYSFVATVSGYVSSSVLLARLFLAGLIGVCCCLLLKHIHLLQDHLSLVI